MRGRIWIALALWASTLAAAQAEVRAEPTAEPRLASSRDPRGDEPGRDVVLERLSRAWAIPARELGERVERLQEAALDLRLANLEGPAQAILLDENAGPERDRAEAARALAPELPAARAARARAHWSDGEPRRALAELMAATRAVPRHVEAERWLEAALWNLAQVTSFAAGAALIVLALILGFPELIRRLGGWSEDLSAPARAALLATLVLAPAAAGEGIFGALLAALALATAIGGWARWGVCALAGAMLVLAVHPALQRGAEARVELANLGVLSAVQQVERAVASPVERERIWQRADRDPMAARALAMETHRRGQQVLADQRFAELLAASDSATLANNAAAARLALGDRETAARLLEEASDAYADPIVLFNLSQVYGALVLIDDQNSALEEAQALDADRVHGLTEVFGPGRMTDLPIRSAEVSATAEPRLDAALLAGAVRYTLAPGLLGRSTAHALAGLGVALAAGFLIGAALGRVGSGEADLRTRITRLVENRAGDSEERIRRLTDLRAREAALARAEQVTQFVVPGFAGLVGRRPWLGGLAVVWASACVCLVLLREGPVAAPLALGSWPDLVFPWLLAFGLIGHVGLTGLSIWLKERA